jgi:hypothetical protein
MPKAATTLRTRPRSGIGIAWRQDALDHGAASDRRYRSKLAAARWEKATPEERAVPEPALLREAFLWSERQSAKKRVKESARWEANAKPPAPKPGYACVRCGAEIGHPVSQAEHNQLPHIGGN